MKNVTRWVVLGVVVLVGMAIWHEIEYRRGQRPDPVQPVRHATVKHHDAKAPAPPSHPGEGQPTSEHGLLIG